MVGGRDTTSAFTNILKEKGSTTLMHLTKFRVRKFRNILDSGEIKVDESVTCLVGMNESGKTAVLTALHRLNPVDSGSFQEKYDYPRWLLARDRKEQLIDSVVPIEATFALDDSDVALLDDALGPDVVKPFDVTVSRRYNATALRSAAQEIGVAGVTARLKSELVTDSRTAAIAPHVALEAR